MIRGFHPTSALWFANSARPIKLRWVSDKHSIAGHWAGEFDEKGLQQWAENLRWQLQTPKVSLGLVFMSPRFFPHAKQVLEILQVHARTPLLAGCSSQGLIVGEQEVEDNPGISLALYWLPDADLKAFHFTQEQVEEANGPGYWRLETAIEPAQTNGWLVFIDPFNLDSETWLKTWNEAYAPLPVLGGLASGDFSEQLTQVYLNGDVFESGGIAISFGGEVKLAGVTSQGCTPIGETWTLTKVDQNIIHKIGNRPAYEVLAETFNALTPEEQKAARGNLFIGLVVTNIWMNFIAVTF